MRKKANTSWLFGLCICVRADCLKAKLTPDSDLSLFSGFLITLRSCLSFKRPSSGVFSWRVSSKQSYCVAAFNETIFYAWWVARSEVHKLEGLGRLWWVLIIFLIFKDINVLVALFVTATIVWRLCWWDIVFVFITKTWCKVFRQRVVKSKHCCNGFDSSRVSSAVVWRWFCNCKDFRKIGGCSQFRSLVEITSATSLWIDRLEDRVCIISICPLCWLGNQSGKREFYPNRSECEIAFLRRPFLLHSSLEKLPRRITEIRYGMF